MPLNVLPLVGSKGRYDLLSPFDVMSVNGEEYTCMAVRRLNDYLANNEDPKTDIYDYASIDETIWEEDLQSNAYIVSLQSDSGHWLYVPNRYIQRYPDVNGVPYRSVMLAIALPSMPVSQPLDPLLNDLKDIAESRLGVTTTAKIVETSKPVLIDSQLHDQKVIERALLSLSNVTLYTQLQTLQQQYDALQVKNQELEQYILTHLGP